MAPFLVLQSSLNILGKVNSIKIGKDILSYLNEITLNIAGTLFYIKESVCIHSISDTIESIGFRTMGLRLSL